MSPAESRTQDLHILRTHRHFVNMEPRSFEGVAYIVKPALDLPIRISKDPKVVDVHVVPGPGLGLRSQNHRSTSIAENSTGTHAVRNLDKPLSNSLTKINAPRKTHRETACAWPYPIGGSQDLALNHSASEPKNLGTSGFETEIPR